MSSTEGKDYQRIPDPQDEVESTTPPPTTDSSKKISTWVVVGSLIFVGVLIGIAMNGNKEPTAVDSFPNYLDGPAGGNFPRPTNTTAATEMGWVKSDVPCNPILGEEWLYKGKRSPNTNVAMHFTPALGDIPGVLSAIEVDYYGYYEVSLEGTYFSEEKTSEDGTYHSLTVGFKDPEKHDLCDPKTTVAPSEKYIAIAPDLINERVPDVATSTELSTEWFAGSCLPGMGFHYVKDTETGPNLQWKASTTTPVVAMYSPATGDISGIFFLATSTKQSAGPTCSYKLGDPCTEDANWWDLAPGLSLLNIQPFYMCANLCSSECHFTGSGEGDDPGYFTTMHFFFEDVRGLICPKPPPGQAGYCRSGDYPIMDA